MVSKHSNPDIPSAISGWLRRQAPEVQKAIHASVDFATDTVRDAVPGEPMSGALDCMRQLADLDVAVPSGRYFKIAHDLLDKAGALAFQIGVAHYKTENELRGFLSLAGTALFANKSAIEHFEIGFSADSALDKVILYLQFELEMTDGGFPGD